MNVQDASNEVYRLLDEHGLIEKGWTFELSNSKRLLGQCRYRDKVIRISRLHIALGDDDEVLDTIRHEVAHAITGPGHHHDYTWKRNAIMVGANPRACAKQLSYTVPHKWELYCGHCGKLVQKRHRRMSPHMMAGRFHRACGKVSAGQLYLQRASA